jgi:RimJ/RimL family protein N-acetyltransferase
VIRTCECNLIAGSIEDASFNAKVSEIIDFWDQLTPDSEEWNAIIPSIHKNPHIRKYKRRHYVLVEADFEESHRTLKDGFFLEKLDVDLLKQSSYENADKLLEWISDWEDDSRFQKLGAGYYIHNKSVIVSWSISECCFGEEITIGIHTDERYRKNGFGQIVVAAVAKECFAKGYKRVNWLCVDTNKGSIALAESLGFRYNNCYDSFSSYPPIENVMDLSETEWLEWSEYLENASQTTDFLIWDTLHCYIKANDVNSTIRIMNSLEQKEISVDYARFLGFITYLQGYGLCSNFRSQAWMDFIGAKDGGK